MSELASDLGASEAGPSGSSLPNQTDNELDSDDDPMDQEEDEPSSSDTKYGMESELKRLKTFPRVWPSNYFNKGECAKNGFYLVDLIIKCFCCSIELSPTNSGAEDLAVKHSTLSPECKFISAQYTKNKPISLALNYNWELHRLITFLRTSWEAPVDCNDLAKWGFYFTGSGDVGRCFICRLEVRGWERGDEGRSEHLKWNPQCPFIQDREVGNVPLGDEIAIIQDAVVSSRNTGLIPVPGSENIRPEQRMNLLDLSEARHSQYAQRADRFQTYNMWPVSIAQRPEQLADAGFYYTGRGDRVVCFYCGGGLKDWGEGDTPWVEHAAWFSSCEFVKIIKGNAFIAQAQSIRAARSASEVQQFNQSTVSNIDVEPVEPEPVEQAVDTSRPRPRLDSERGGDEANSSSELDESTRQLRMCKVCYLKELGIVFLPCGHMATCPDCAPQLTSCPICRAKANAYVRAYLP